MKEIEIKDINELNKKLWIYKSVFYRNVKFVSSVDDEQVISTINALNIKNRYNRIAYIYDYCCNYIDKFYEGKNICGFVNGQCINQQTPKCDHYDGCCRLCIHQNGKGCETKNLTCKFFFCDTIKSKEKILKYNDFNVLKLFSLRQKLMIKSNYFITREESIKDLFFGSIIIFGITMVIRIIRDFGILGFKREWRIKRKRKN